MIRAFLDTNVLFSAILSGSGPPRQLLHLAAAGAFEPCISEQVLRELAEVFARPRARKLLGKAFNREELVTILSDLTKGMVVSFGEVAETQQVPGDPKDNHILSAAVQLQVDYLVTGDATHLFATQRQARPAHSGHPHRHTAGVS